MRRSTFTDEQILAVVKEGDAGRKVADVCRAHAITDKTYYRWKAKYGGLELSEMRRLNQPKGTGRHFHADPLQWGAQRAGRILEAGSCSRTTNVSP